MFDSQMLHAEIPLPKPTVHSAHPFKNEKHHEILLQYLTARLELGKNDRDHRLPRLAKIDKDVSGWIRHSEADEKIIREREQTGDPVAVKMSLPLNFVHLDDMMTYFTQTFAPSRGMFYHTGSPDDAGPASQIVTLMNNHAVYGGYYRQTVLTIFNILKYNLGGFTAQWTKDSGPVLGTDSTGAATVMQEQIVWQGNKIEALDMYNTFVDPSVHPTQLYKDGEFAGKSKLVSHYWLQSKASQGYYFNVEDCLREDSGVTRSKYYRNPPVEAKLSRINNNGTDWVSILSDTPEYAQSTGYELTEIMIRLNPFQLNLIPRNAENKVQRNRYEIWRFTVLGAERIIECTAMNNVHGFIPYFFGLLNDDSMGTSQKSVSEILQPLQDFASFLINTHVAATRKNIWGSTFYDPTCIDLNAIPAGEVSARIPLKAAGYGKDIRTMVYHDHNPLDTEQTLGDLEKITNLVNTFFPTQSLPSQIASIDRAIDSQVAAVQQGANRRLHKAGRLIDDSLFRPLRFCFYYNIIQYQPDNTSINDFYGKSVNVDLSTLRSTDLPFIVGQGIKAVDMQAAAGKLQQIIFALIQNPQAAQQIDLVGLIDYWTSLIDIDIDMTKFHVQPPAVGPDGQPIPGAPVVPVTNPASVTQPLTKAGGPPTA